MANAPPPPTSGQFGKYWLERRIALGGTAEVYLARHGGPGGPAVVIKRPLPELRQDPASTGLFQQEARLHQIVRHPNVVEVYEMGVVEGEPYLAMQYIDGVDAYRLLRRLQADDKRPPPRLAIHVGLSLCEALDAVHNARDAQGAPLTMVHRDVTPSNVYLSAEGDVFLGDFGIARPLTRISRPTGNVLKGKLSYLAPEQIGGEPADHRADIFSCAVVVSELLLGRPLFAGAGQVAVMLAIREGRIDALRAARDQLPFGLVDVLSRALARDPAARYPTARALAQALERFESTSGEGQAAVREWVAWARDTRGLARRLGGALLESESRLRPTDPPPEGGPSTLRQGETDELIPVSFPPEEGEPVTARIDEVPSAVRFADGRTLAGVRFGRLIEMAVTGELSIDDQVDLMGQGLRRVGDIELLERHLPGAATTRNVQTPASPDDGGDLAQAHLLPLLGRLARARATGLLLIEGRPEGEREMGRREIYLQAGQVVHVTSGDTGDLLGQSLVRRGLLSNEDLDMALAVMPRFQGRLGDTLIALGLVDAVVLFRSIEGQGRERFLRVFSWSHGRAQFFRGAQPNRLEFPLELELSTLLLEGMEIAYPNDTPIIQSRSVLGMRVRATEAASDPSITRSLPPGVMALLRTAGEQGVELRHALARLATSADLQPASALRAMYVAIALGLCEVH